MNCAKQYKEALERVSPKFRIGDRIKHKTGLCPAFKIDRIIDMDYIGVDGEHVGIAVQDCWELVGETESGDLDKASKDILKDFGAIATTDKGLRLYSEDSMLGICKAGANWQMRQMMKDAKDAIVIMTHVTNESLSPALSVVILPDTYHEGDKVKVIIVKKG